MLEFIRQHQLDGPTGRRPVRVHLHRQPQQTGFWMMRVARAERACQLEVEPSQTCECEGRHA